MLRFLLITFFSFFCINNFIDVKALTYKHQGDWELISATCAGKRQSPINIDDDKVVKNKGEKLSFESYNEIPEKLTLDNVGHTVVLKPEFSSKNSTPRISGGPLNGTYILGEMNFHWDVHSDKKGTEHSLNFLTYSLEIQQVHYKENYTELYEAVLHEDGLAIIAHLYKMDKNATKTTLSLLEEPLKKVVGIGSSSEVEKTGIANFGTVLPEKYYSYEGSATFPPCFESVTWLIDSELRPISAKQLELFRKVQLMNDDDHNYRKIQHLGSRNVTLQGSE